MAIAISAKYCYANKPEQHVPLVAGRAPLRRQQEPGGGRSLVVVSGKLPQMPPELLAVGGGER